MPAWLVILQMSMLTVYLVESRTTRRRSRLLHEQAMLALSGLERELRADRKVINFILKSHEDLSVDFTRFQTEAEGSIRRLLEELPSIDC